MYIIIMCLVHRVFVFIRIANYGMWNHGTARLETVEPWNCEPKNCNVCGTTYHGDAEPTKEQDLTKTGQIIWADYNAS